MAVREHIDAIEAANDRLREILLRIPAGVTIGARCGAGGIVNADTAAQISGTAAIRRRLTRKHAAGACAVGRPAVHANAARRETASLRPRACVLESVRTFEDTYPQIDTSYEVRGAAE